MRWLLGLWLFYAYSVCAVVSVTDDAGDFVELQQPAQRIVTLAPNLAELIFAIDAGDRVVGVSDYTDYPEKACNIPRVASFDHIDLERLLKLHPDLVVAWPSVGLKKQLQYLRTLGIPVYVSDMHHLSDVPDTLLQLSKLTATEEAAQVAANKFNQELQALQYRYGAQAGQPVRVFYQLWSNPIMTVNHDDLISQVISLCGGANIFADAKLKAARVSAEAVIEKNPEVIINGADSNAADALTFWQQWPQISAVANKRLYNFKAVELERYSPRILQGAQQLCKLLHDTN